MKLLILIAALLAIASSALAAVPLGLDFLKPIFDDEKEEFRGSWKEVAAWLKAQNFSDSQKALFMEQLVRSREYSRENYVQDLDEVLRVYLGDKPSAELLEDAALLLSDYATSTAPIPHTAELANWIHEHAKPDAGGVFRILRRNREALGLARPASPSLEELGIVSVQSVYANDHQAKAEVGTGFVVETNGKKFLVSDAHLLAGSAPKFSGGTLNSLDLLFDGQNDLAVIQLADSGTPAALTFNSSGNFELSPALADSLREGTIPLLNAESISLDNPLEKIYEMQGMNAAFFTRNPAIDYKMLYPPWATPIENSDRGERRNYSYGPELVSDGTKIHVLHQTAPGMSGALLFSVPSQGLPRAEGVLSQYNAYFSSSYYSPLKFVRALLEAYSSGQRGKLHAYDPDWRMKRGLLYRDYGKGTSEADFINAPSGNGIYLDPGNGVYLDPYTGTPTGKEPAGNPDGKKTAASRMREYGLRAGILWEGKSVIGFAAQPKNPGRSPFLLYANAEAISFMREQAANYDFTAVPEGADLMPYLRQKLRNAFGSNTNSFSESFKLKPGDDFGAGEDDFLQGNENGIELSLTTGGIDSTSHQDYRDTFRLQLDSHGLPPGSNTFFPIVEIRTRALTYYVDLRPLYFTDLSTVAQAYSRGADRKFVETFFRGPESFEEALEAANRNIGLEWSSLDRGTEDATNFVPWDCEQPFLERGNPKVFLKLGKYSRYRCEPSSHY